MLLKPVANAAQTAYPTLEEHRQNRASWLQRVVYTGAVGGLVLAAGTMIGALGQSRAGEESGAGETPNVRPPGGIQPAKARLRGQIPAPESPAPSATAAAAATPTPLPPGIMPAPTPSASPAATPTAAPGQIALCPACAQRTMPPEAGVCQDCGMATASTGLVLCPACAAARNACPGCGAPLPDPAPTPAPTAEPTAYPQTEGIMRQPSPPPVFRGRIRAPEAPPSPTPVQQAQSRGLMRMPEVAPSPHRPNAKGGGRQPRQPD